LYAATKGDFDILTLLLEKGATPSVKNKAGETALHFASSHGHLGIVGTLLTLMDIESLTIGRQSPLYYAARHNKLDIVKYLLNYRPIAKYSIPLVSFPILFHM
jgi:ankyrin repeat protein